MKKIVLLAYITILFIGSTSSCMLLNLQRFSPMKRFFCTKLSRHDYIKLCELIKKNKIKIHALKQEPTINIRAIWHLEDQIKKNKRILNTHNRLEQQHVVEE